MEGELPYDVRSREYPWRVPACAHPDVVPLAEEIVRLGRRYEWWGDREYAWCRAWLVVNHVLGAATAVLAGVAGSVALGGEDLSGVAGVLALCAAGLGALLTFLNPVGRAGGAKEAAMAAWEVCKLARYQIAAELPSTDLAGGKALLTAIQEREAAAVKLVGHVR